MRGRLKRTLIMLAKVGLVIVTIVALVGTVLPLIAMKLALTTQPAASAPAQR